MKFGYTALIAMFTLHATLILVDTMNVQPILNPLTPSQSSETISELNATLVDTWEQGPEGNLYGDIRAQTRFLWNLFSKYIWTMPTMARAFGAPAGISTALDMVWLGYWTLFLLWFFGGRDMES